MKLDDVTMTQAPTGRSLDVAIAGDGPWHGRSWDDADASDSLSEGDRISFDLTAANTGTEPLFDVALGLRAPGATAFAPASGVAGLTDLDEDGAADDLAAGARASATLAHTIAASDEGAPLEVTARARAADIAAVTATHQTAPARDVTGRIEGGTLVVDSPVGGDRWFTVTFDTPIPDARVIVGPPTEIGTHPAVMRVRNVSDTGFEVQLQEWEYQNGIHPAETVSWIAGTAGVHELASGQRVEFGSFQLENATPGTQALTGFDTTPAVFVQIASFNGAEAVSDRTLSVSASAFTAQMQEEQDRMESSNGDHSRETVHWLAAELGARGAVDVQIPGTLSHVGTDVHFDPPANDLVLIADAQTMNGIDPGALRVARFGGSPRATSVRLYFEEEKSVDNEQEHADETFAVLTMGAGSQPLFAPQ